MTCPAPLIGRSISLLLIALSAPVGFAQPGAQRAKPPAFDVASIHQNVDPQIRWRMQFTSDGVTAEDVTLQYALEEAYGLYDPSRWSGGPDWLTTRRFNIEARFDPAEYPDATLDQRRAMLQNLLADRCKLAVHHAPTEFPLYALVVNRNGLKLSESKPETLSSQNIYGTSCLVTRSRPYHLEMKDCTTKDFASILMGAAREDLDRPVIDQTGLSGRYDFALNWSPQDPAAADRLNADGPALFTALEKQLGLKLEPTKGMLDTIVIDHIEMPAQN